MAGGAVGMQETVALQIMSGVVHEWVDCEGVQQSELHFEVAGNSFYCPPPSRSRCTRSVGFSRAFDLTSFVRSEFIAPYHHDNRTQPVGTQPLTSSV